MATVTRRLTTAAAILIGITGWAHAQQSTITPTALELNKAFDADIEQWRDRFEHEGRGIFDNRYRILDELGLQPGKSVADIGAGSGLMSRLIAQRVGPTGTVYAVDIAKNMIDHIAKTAVEQNIPNLKAVHGDVKSPRLEPQSVDVVCIIDSYHHFEFPKEMLAEIRKALRPDGQLVLVDFKRVEGVSQPFILQMVRAGQGTFMDEFKDAGFDLVERQDEFMPENYLMKFKVRQAAPRR